MKFDGVGKFVTAMQTIVVGIFFGMVGFSCWIIVKSLQQLGIL